MVEGGDHDDEGSSGPRFGGESRGKRSREQRLAFLCEASERLTPSLREETVLSTLTELCVPTLADWATVELAGDDARIETAAVAHADRQKVAKIERARDLYPPVLAATSGIGKVLRTGEAECSTKITDEFLVSTSRTTEHEQMLRELGLDSYIILPLRLKDRVLGTLTLVSARPDRRYDDNDLELAKAVAGRAARAIDHGRSYREIGQARKKAEEAAQRVGVLASLTEPMASSLNPTEALKQLSQSAVSSIADCCVAYELEENGAIRRVAVAHSDPHHQQLIEDIERVAPPHLDDPVGVGKVLRTGEPVLATQILDADLERTAEHTDHLLLLEHLALCSSIVVPLKARNRTLGALALATTEHSGRIYGDADLFLAQELAHRAALLVDNARLYHSAQEATRARDHILSVVSHDLRSPLNNIVTACELLELDPPEPRRSRTHASIRRAAKQMNRLLEDLLDVARIEEQRLTLDRETMDLATLMSDVISLHHPVAEKRSVQLRQNVSTNVAFDGDRKRLTQGLSNLVDNALKFTPDDGTIDLAAEAESGDVRISVTDSGPGIPDEQVARLFDRFWRSDDARTTGVGLGLAIAKGIAQAHGGTIEVEQAPQKGARFTILLPQRVVRRASRPPEKKRTVLVVDDDG